MPDLITTAQQPRRPLTGPMVQQRERLVERRGWLRSSDVSEALAKPLPGSTVV